MYQIITIGREFGSGGREFGRRLAEELGYEYYDKEIITEISKHTSLSEEYVQDIIEKKPHRLYPITIGQSLTGHENYELQQVQMVFQAQCEIIERLATQSNCVIVGRCADYILREYQPYRIFIYAQMDSKVKRCIERNSASSTYTEKQIRKHIARLDKERAKYYQYYTGQKWGKIQNYDLCINTTHTIIKDIVPLIAKMFQ
ncbi:MAG: cytidylate kinase-like family protein [Prevotella sp.]|nr:cytidylate kinase-like family protein [Staphylococcus sp.]MCM1350468.1 cytidylate kinase-like family protein [Prevotella sp.]